MLRAKEELESDDDCSVVQVAGTPRTATSAFGNSSSRGQISPPVQRRPLPDPSDMPRIRPPRKSQLAAVLGRACAASMASCTRGAPLAGRESSADQRKFAPSHWEPPSRSPSSVRTARSEEGGCGGKSDARRRRKRVRVRRRADEDEVRRRRAASESCDADAPLSDRAERAEARKGKRRKRVRRRAADVTLARLDSCDARERARRQAAEFTLAQFDSFESNSPASEAAVEFKHAEIGVPSAAAAEEVCGCAGQTLGSVALVGIADEPSPLQRGNCYPVRSDIPPSFSSLSLECTSISDEISDSQLGSFLQQALAPETAAPDAEASSKETVEPHEDMTQIALGLAMAFAACDGAEPDCST